MTTFQHRIRHIRRVMRVVRTAGVLLAVTAAAALLWLALGLADAALSLEPAARVALTAGLWVSCAMMWIAGLLIAWKVPAAAAAAKADELLADPRRGASAALALDPGSSPTPLSRMLAERALEGAGAALGELRFGQLISRRWLGLLLLGLLLPLAAIGCVKLAWPSAFAVVSQRLLHPSRDIPPYSRFVFTIHPENPSTVYGGGVLVSAEISGAAVNQPVECLIRKSGGGDILRLPAFRESATRFSRKPDGLTEPIDIAFACGRARSAWRRIEVLLEPEILGGTVRLVPPEYTGLDAVSFALDTNEIAAVEGSKVTLEITSNRPLGSGDLTFTPITTPGSEPVAESVKASLSSAQTASFTWIAVKSGRLSATLRDVRGTPSPKPLELSFKLLPDQAPEVVLTSPPPMMLATPKSVIPLNGRAQDDFALAKVNLVRTLSGFRDRVHVVAPALNGKSFDFSDKLDLDELGLVSGQTIELTLDAADHNPSLLGQGSSEISRIRVISEDEYAAYIRARTTVDQFSKRFEAARGAMDKAREALGKLKKAVDEGKRDEAAKALEDAAKAHREAIELMERIAADFPAFELEKRLKELAEKQLEDLRGNLRDLEGFDPGAADDARKQAVEEMLKRLERQAPRAREIDEDFRMIDQMAQLLEMAARFRRIYEAQASLAKRFGTITEELRRGIDQNKRLLPSLADTQEKNRQALDDFKAELKRRAEALPKDEALVPMIDSALGFLRDLEEAQPESLMDAAARHGRAGEAREAFNQAELARELLLRLMSKPEMFPQAAAGRAPELNLPRPDVNRNLEQMLEALLGQNQGDGGGNQGGRQGGAPGPGGVAGGDRNGFPMDLPVVGPDRLWFENSDTAGGGSGGTGAAKSGVPPTTGKGSIQPGGERQGQSSTATPEAVPENYRDAVKRFLTP